MHGDPPAAPAQAGPQPNAGQREAVDTMAAALGGFAPFLLHGVTGSGKTEVYIRLIERALAAGRQSLLLVPEIGLAPQTVARLRARLGVPVDVLHSNLAEGARASTWLRAREGRARVILGTRSAVFAPLPEAGLIMVDEEHDTSYKQQEGFRYHARDLAVVRAQRLGVPVVLGSATPSLETLANVEAGRYRRLTLRERTGAHSTPPRAEILDVRGQSLQHGLSNALLAALDECLARGEQALIFRNRRGYAPAADLPPVRLARRMPALRETAGPAPGAPPAGLPPLRPGATGAGHLPAVRQPGPVSARAMAPSGWRRPCRPVTPTCRCCASTARPRAAATPSRTCSARWPTAARRSWSARRCWPRATTCPTSRWSPSPASTRACTAWTSAPANAWRS